MASDMAEGFMKLLQQIQGTLTEINETLKAQQNQNSRSDAVSVSEAIAVPPDVVEEFRDCLKNCHCDRLSELVSNHPAELFLQTFRHDYRSALHVAVMGSSAELMDALLTKLPDLKIRNDRDNGTSRSSAGHGFLFKADRYGLTAIDMAAIIGKPNILARFIDLGVLNRIGNGQNPHWDTDRAAELREEESMLVLELDKPVPRDIVPIYMQSAETWRDCLLYWSSNPSATGDEFCLHEAAKLNPTDLAIEVACEFVKQMCRSGQCAVLKPLLSIRDVQGRTPLHLCLDPVFDPPLIRSKTINERFLETLIEHFPGQANVRDSLGRTPLHWAAAQGFSNTVTKLAEKGNIDLNATYDSSISQSDTHDQKLYFQYLRVRDVTALHLAVIHNHVEVVEALLKAQGDPPLDVNQTCYREVQLDNDGSDVMDRVMDREHSFRFRRWTPLQLAAYMGHERILQVLLSFKDKKNQVYDFGLKTKITQCDPQKFEKRSALHYATLQFHPVVVKSLVHSRMINVSVKDTKGNTALHYATAAANGCLEANANMHDYVSIFHFESNRPKPLRSHIEDDIVACLDILMQAGLDMKEKNIDGNTPTLPSTCPQSVQKWWLRYMEMETQEKMNNLTAAANAISVTATLVATASFVGPLQPPLGLLSDPNSTWLNGYSQVKHTSVEVFLFCDNLSFYLAIASIIFAILPSWPIPHEGFAQEVRVAQRCVQIAIFLLFASIIFVVCAFSAASIAVVPEDKWRYMTLTVVSISLGTFVCFFILLLSFMRLLTLISSTNTWTTKMSDIANSILLWDGFSK